MTDKFKPNDRVVMVKDREDFGQGRIPHPPHAGVVVQTYTKAKVLVRWHAGYANFYPEDKLELA